MTTLPRCLIAALTALVLTFVAGVCGAQVSDEQREYFEEWQKTATRAEQVIDARRASSALVSAVVAPSGNPTTVHTLTEVPRRADAQRAT